MTAVKSSMLKKLIKKVRDFLMAQLRQGSSPQTLAVSCAVGAVCGIFPLFGTTTMLGVGIGMAFRLNQPALQAVNYAMAAPQIILIPILCFLGESIFGAEHVSLNPATFASEFFETPKRFLSHYGWAAAYATFAWCLVAPLFGLIIYGILLPLLKKSYAKLKKS